MTWLTVLSYLLLGGVLGSSITVTCLDEQARQRAQHDHNLID